MLTGPTIGKLPKEDIDTPLKVSILTGLTIPELKAMTPAQRAELAVLVTAPPPDRSTSAEPIATMSDEMAARMARVKQAAVFDDAPMRAAQDRRQKARQRTIPGFVAEDDGQEDERWENLTEENKKKRWAFHKEQDEEAKRDAAMRAKRGAIRAKEKELKEAKEQRRRADARNVKEKEKRRKAAAAAKAAKESGGSNLADALGVTTKAERKRAKMLAKKQRKKDRTPEAIEARRVEAAEARAAAKRAALEAKAAAAAEALHLQRPRQSCCCCLGRWLLRLVVVLHLVAACSVLAPLGRELLAPFPKDSSADVGLQARFARGMEAVRDESVAKVVFLRDHLHDADARRDLLATLVERRGETIAALRLKGEEIAQALPAFVAGCVHALVLVPAAAALFYQASRDSARETCLECAATRPLSRAAVHCDSFPSAVPSRSRYAPSPRSLPQTSWNSP